MKKHESKSQTKVKEQESENRAKAVKNVMDTFKVMYDFIDRFVEQRSSEKSQ